MIAARTREELPGTHVVVVAVGTVLVALLVIAHVLAERLLALLAEEGHLGRFAEAVVLGLGVALGAVEPLFAAGGADGDLGVENVFAGRVWLAALLDVGFVVVVSCVPHGWRC